MKYPRTNFITNNTQKEAEYICFLAKAISEGFYQKAGLLVLPKPVKASNTVYFPNLRYSSEFWRLIKNCKNSDLSKPFPVKAVEEVRQKLKNNYQFDQKNWEKVEKRFFALVYKFLNGKKLLEKISSIDVLVTKYGTTGSFFPTKINGKYKIYTTLRTDLPTETLVKTLLLAFYKITNRQSDETGNNRWNFRQSIVEFLLKHTSFKEIAPKNLKPAHPKYLTTSKKYLMKLGFTEDDVITLNSKGKIMIKGNSLNNLLTKQEEHLLTYMINHKGKLVNFDRTAQILWEKQSWDKYSPFAMAKVVQNLRDKIRNSGVNKNLIHTVRGKGYILLTH